MRRSNRRGWAYRHALIRRWRVGSCSLAGKNIDASEFRVTDASGEGGEAKNYLAAIKG